VVARLALKLGNLLLLGAVLAHILLGLLEDQSAASLCLLLRVSYAEKRKQITTLRVSSSFDWRSAL
jgi:hypothetical protein